MQTQDVDRHSSGGRWNEALASHERVFANSAYSFSRNSAMLAAGCTRVTLTSPFGRSAGFVPTTPDYVDKRDRRNTCRTASRAFSQLALWPLSQLAHSPHRKNSSLSSPSRFRPSRSSPVNTSNLFKVEMGQAASPVPLLSRCGNRTKIIDLGQYSPLLDSDTQSAGDCKHGYRTKPQGEDKCFIKQKLHFVSSQLADSWPVASRNRRRLSVFSQVSQNMAKPFVPRTWFCRVISVSRQNPQRLPLLPALAPLTVVAPQRAAQAVQIPVRTRVRTQERTREQGLDRGLVRARVPVPDRAPARGLAAAYRPHPFHNHSSIPQAAAGWTTAPFAEFGALS
ncbi:hypothetical protein ROG8370_01116 [Roseovarius gaetbuli]|uniref:Uncharacterized protein n=1 Tax=Roseovarius gaetbuli TaxID=1356575 RepID=A0A1X6YRA3_9RHOB|nr:hypothetical protein ROG8370_01116 [Roseovarius gaetbuli]